MKDSTLDLDDHQLYLIDGMQRYYAAQELNLHKYNMWWTRKLEQNYSIEDVQIVSWQCLVLSNTVTPMTFVDKCNIIVKFMSNYQ